MSDQTPQDPYAGQPYYGQYPPQYPQQQYPQQPYPQQYGQYPPQPGNPYAYPYPYPYPYPPPPGRPGTATAAAVLAFVAAGLLIVAALILFTGASIIHDIGDSVRSNTDPTTTEFSFDGIVDLISATLLISGGVMFAGRKAAGRTMLATAAHRRGIVASTGSHASTPSAATVFDALLFAALGVIAIAIAPTTASSRAWLTAAAPANRPEDQAETCSPERSSSASTCTVCPSRISPASSARASVSPIAVCTSRRSGRAP